jgi:hypothetical protein
MRAVGAVNCDPPGGARVSVVPLLTPRKSCGGGACGLPGRVAGAEVHGANDGVGWWPGRGGLRGNCGFPLCPRMLCNVVAGSHRPRAGAAAASPPTLQHVNFLKLRDAGRVHHPVLCVVCGGERASLRVCRVCAMTAPPAVAARVSTQQLLRDMLSSATPVPDTLVPAAAAALRQGCAPRPAPRGCGERQGAGFALAVYPGC